MLPQAHLRRAAAGPQLDAGGGARRARRRCPPRRCRSSRRCACQEPDAACGWRGIAPAVVGGCECLGGVGRWRDGGRGDSSDECGAWRGLPRARAQPAGQERIAAAPGPAPAAEVRLQRCHQQAALAVMRLRYLRSGFLSDFSHDFFHSIFHVDEGQHAYNHSLSLDKAHFHFQNVHTACWRFVSAARSIAQNHAVLYHQYSLCFIINTRNPEPAGHCWRTGGGQPQLTTDVHELHRA